MSDARRARAALRDLRLRGLRRGDRQLRGGLGRAPAAAAGPARTAPASSSTPEPGAAAGRGRGPDRRAARSRSRTAACSCSTPTAWSRDRHRDIDDGPATACATSSGPGPRPRPLEDLCRATLAGVYADQQRDDIAMLIARLSRIPADNHVTWTLPAELTSAAGRRGADPRAAGSAGTWPSSCPTTELLVSELVTNADPVRPGHDHAAAGARGRPGLSRCSTTRPRCPGCATPDEDEECGRGLQVVSQLAQRWGARRTPQPARSSGASRPCRTPATGTTELRPAGR